MGRDKACLPHPRGGVWLTALVEQLRPLPMSCRVLTRHQSHGELLSDEPAVEVLIEPPPWNGPLQALSRVLPAGPQHALLVLPVDMPLITTAEVQQLIAAWRQRPEQVAVAHDGGRLQPLFCVIPSGPPFQTQLLQQLEAGQLRWMDWLQQVPSHEVVLSAEALLNANRPEDLAALER